MSELRSVDQVAADFRRIDPRFTEVSDLGTLSGLLTDDRLGDAAVFASGAGPVLYDLGILSGPGWNGVRQFLNSRLVSSRARLECERLEQDLRAADRNGDGILNNQEIVAFAQAHTDRWPNVATFRNAADVFLNRLPGYLSQANLNDQQVARLWGVMNHLAGEYRRLGASQTNRGTVYGLSLQGFPSSDRGNPPPLIRRALNGELTPQELAAVHRVLEVGRSSTGQYEFSGAAPLSPLEIGALGQILERASASGHRLNGMTIVAGAQESRLFAGRNRATERCMTSIAAAARSRNETALERVFGQCSTDLSRMESDHPERIGARTLLLRAYTGDLSSGETALLRAWMQREGRELGLVCDGTWDCMAQGARQLFRGIAKNPGHFIARNAAFIGGSILYRRLILRNAFERRLGDVCGSKVANANQAYRGYERYLADQMKSSPVWRRLLNQLASNPRRAGFLGRLGINFPVTFLHLAAFNAIASRKDTGKDRIDIPTDLPLIPLFHAFDTADAFRRSTIQNFANAHPEACRQNAESANAPAPETVAATEPVSQPAPESQMSLMPDYSEMICRATDVAPGVELDPELASIFHVLNDSRAIVPDRASAGTRTYLTLDQISVETAGTASGSSLGRPAIAGTPIQIPSLEPVIGLRPAPALRFR